MARRAWESCWNQRYARKHYFPPQQEGHGQETTSEVFRFTVGLRQNLR
jgi:hypothetical protein